MLHVSTLRREKQLSGILWNNCIYPRQKNSLAQRVRIPLGTGCSQPWTQDGSTWNYLGYDKPYANQLHPPRNVQEN